MTTCAVLPGGAAATPASDTVYPRDSSGISQLGNEHAVTSSDLSVLVNNTSGKPAVNGDPASAEGTADGAANEPGASAVSAEPEGGGVLEPDPAPVSEAERVFSAFIRAYPGKFDGMKQMHDDWAIRLAGRWFYWAHGRLLPEEIREQWEKYDPIPFYSYPNGLPPIPEYSKEEKAEIEKQVKERESRPLLRNPDFYNALWRIHDRTTSWERVKTTYFLGLKTQIHRELLEDLAAVEEEVLSAAKSDRALAKYVDSLSNLEGYNWRPIAGTSSLSYHSYGTAIDIIPKYYGGKQVYWRWAMAYFPEWYALPYSKRFIPPESFIRIFENHGFVWGGKWLYFDTIHFEYRPEILILNGVFPPGGETAGE